MQRFILSLLLLAFVTTLSAQDSFSSTLPIIVINTQGLEIMDEPKVTARMGVIDNGPGERNELSDDFNAYDGFIGIEGRGSTSQYLFPKIGYGFETRLANGTDNQVELLGFPIEEDFVLNGPYSDKSLIRNALAYNLAGKIMPYAPRIRMVEVVINNDYLGVYLLTENIKRDRNRVDIKKLSPEDVSGNQLTGGYILKLDKFTGENFDFPILFESNYSATTEMEQTILFLYHYPKPENIVGSQRTYIENWMHNFEEVLASDDFLDPNNGYRQYIDLKSFVDFMLINEISRNVDGYRISTYLYKKRDDNGGKLHMGPVWDFNLAFGNANYCGSASPRGWGYNFGNLCPEDDWQLPFWWDRLREDPDFLLLLADRWEELRAGVFSNERLNGTIDSLVIAMDDAPQRNFSRWPVIGNYVWPNAFIGNSYEDEIDYLKNWMEERTYWMDLAIQDLSSRENFISASSLIIHPNPTDGLLYLFTGESSEVFTFQVYDAYGRLALTKDQVGQRNSIDLSLLKTGVYFIQVRKSDGEIIGGKVMKR